jgi:hypothetical protein
MINKWLPKASDPSRVRYGPLADNVGRAGMSAHRVIPDTWQRPADRR